LAGSLGIDLAHIKGTGPLGAIVRSDIGRGPIRAAPPVALKHARGFDADAMRAAIAAAMAHSKREIPHYYLQHQVDMSVAEEMLRRINASRPPEGRLITGVLAVKAVALAAVKHPRFNGRFRDGRFEAAAGVHVGMAISLRGGGLAAPAIHDVAALTLEELMSKMRDLIARVRAGRMRSSEISDPTITVSSLGERGVEALYGVIYPPQVAIVGMGKVAPRPWIVDNQVVARPVTTITLAADHLVSDGHAGALFLSDIAKLLEKPETL
jgi:pyruvate dehydrogenase E2 component (dihydrolipoamide acetyltransferase)